MTENPIGRLGAWLLPAICFTVVLAAQLWLVAVAGTDIPFQDQWDAEGRTQYPALLDGSSKWGDYFQPHNEHRIVWTRLLDAALFKVNGQWDPLVQMVAGAWLHAAEVALLAALLVRGFGQMEGVILGGFVTLLSLPLAGWHNALWGFQSQVYFAVGFSIAAFALLAAPAPAWPRALAGWLMALAAMLAMGPGLLVPVVLAGGMILSGRWRAAWPGLALIVVAGLLHQSVPEHEVLHAGTLAQFMTTLVRLLAWPFADQAWPALVLNLPLLLVAGGRLLKRHPAGSGEDFVLLLAGWTVAVAFGAAWSRGGGGEFTAGVPSRYVDLVALLPLANVWFVVVLIREAAERWRPSVRLVAAAWGVLLFAGWLGLSAEVMRGVILSRARDRDAPVRLMQEFQRTGEADVFAGQPRLLVPHPNLDSVRAVLQDPRMEGVLPPSLQPGQPVGPLSRVVRTGLGR